MSSRLAVLALTFCTTAAAACGERVDAPTGPSSPASFAGTYALQTVNGAPLPYTLLDLGLFRLVIISDVLTFRNDGVVTETNTSDTFQQGIGTSRRTQTGVGSFTVRGNTVTVTWPVSGIYTYTRNGSLLSVFEPQFGATWVYRRQ